MTNPPPSKPTRAAIEGENKRLRSALIALHEQLPRSFVTSRAIILAALRGGATSEDSQ
jgi:hypothetical protein